MNKVNFVSAWKNFNQNTWSGTPYSIMNSLSKKTSLNLIDISTKQKKGIFQKISNVKSIINANLNELNSGRKKLDKLKDINIDIPTIVFSEYNCKNAKNFYCYQDLSVDFLLRSKRIEFRAPFLKTLIKKNYLKKNKIALSFYNKCAGIFTMSEWLKKDLVENTKIPEEKVHVVGGGCNVDVSKINYSKKKGNKFLFVGVDWQRKNGELVVKAFNLLKKSCPEIELYIIGPSTCPNSIINTEGVHFIGKLPSNELYKYYNLCDYFVMPSTFEAYGLVFTEALSFGLPCIGKNCYAMPEFIKDGENGYLIENDDEFELFEKMKALLKNEKTMVEKVQNDKNEYIKKYSWDSVAERISLVLKKDGYLK